MVDKRWMMIREVRFEVCCNLRDVHATTCGTEWRRMCGEPRELDCLSQPIKASGRTSSMIHPSPAAVGGVCLHRMHQLPRLSCPHRIVGRHLERLAIWLQPFGQWSGLQHGRAGGAGFLFLSQGAAATVHAASANSPRRGGPVRAPCTTWSASTSNVEAPTLASMGFPSRPLFSPRRCSRRLLTDHSAASHIVPYHTFPLRITPADSHHCIASTLFHGPACLVQPATPRVRVEMPSARFNFQLLAALPSQAARR